MAGDVGGLHRSSPTHWFLSRDRPRCIATRVQESLNHSKNIGVTLIEYVKNDCYYNKCTHYKYFIPSCLGILSQYTESTGKLHVFLRHPLELQYYLLRPKCLV